MLGKLLKISADIYELINEVGLLKRGNCSFSKVKTVILCKLANFVQITKSKTILESEKKILHQMGKKIFQIFFPYEIDFSHLVLWSKSTPPPKGVFFCS